VHTKRTPARALSRSDRDVQRSNWAGQSRVAIVTPAYNEQATLHAVATSVFKQNLKPAMWVIVDDGSSDETLQVARKIAEGRAWISVVEKERASGICDESFMAFKVGVSVTRSNWDFLMKLDADTTLPERFLERLIAEFETDPALGIASGMCAGEPVLWLHPRGNNRVYRAECWKQITFPEDGLGWDTVDEVFARLNGWQTKAFSDLVCEHMRSKLPDAKYRFHQGRLSRHLGYFWWFVLGRSAKMLVSSGIQPSFAYLAGYLKGGFGSTDESVKRAVRMDQRNRAARIVGLE
jgi:glycosyltransferase involved in cell wall biosynthesis